MDSLSDIADTPDFPPADSLSQVPTIWDVSTGPSAHDKVSAPSLQAGSHAKAAQTQTTLLLKVAPVSHVGLKMQGLPGGRGTLGAQDTLVDIGGYLPSCLTGSVPVKPLDPQEGSGGCDMPRAGAVGNAGPTPPLAAGDRKSVV